MCQISQQPLKLAPTFSPRLEALWQVFSPQLELASIFSPRLEALDQILSPKLEQVPLLVQALALSSLRALVWVLQPWAQF
jgi:hypothetical protein